MARETGPSLVDGGAALAPDAHADPPVSAVACEGGHWWGDCFDGGGPHEDAGAREPWMDGLSHDAGEPEPDADVGLSICSDLDTDMDGWGDCVDGCPEDPAKRAAGQCGCGHSDADADGDGVADCNDHCDYDPLKVEKGECGCGVPEQDSDGDGTLDCRDRCVNDPHKDRPGDCGCGVRDLDINYNDVADCEEGEGAFEVCSAYGEDLVELEVENQCGIPLQLVWIDFDCVEQHTTWIDPRKKFKRNTFEGYVWKVADAQGRVAARWVIDDHNRRVRLECDHFE